MVGGSNPGGGEIFRTCPNRAWGPPRLLYNGYRLFPGIKSGRGVTLTPHPLLVPWSWKSRAIPLLPLWTVRPVQSLSACTRVTFTFIYKSWSWPSWNETCRLLLIEYFYTGWSESLCAPDDYSTHTIDDFKMAIIECIRNVDRAILNTVFENTIRRVNKYLETAGGTLNITCNFLYCNYQVHREYLITLYKKYSWLLTSFVWISTMVDGKDSSSSRRWTSFSWKFWPSQRPLSISLDPGRRLSSFGSSVGKCPDWCYPPICTWVFIVIFWLGVSS